MAEKNNPNEIRITRIYDAPVKAVWDAWMDPKQLAQWWGPRGFTLTTHSREVAPGGTWRFTMHGPGGVDYPNKASYLEVEKYSRLVYDHGADDDLPPHFRVTVVFSESRGKTTMEMRMALPTPEAAVQTRKFIKSAGGESTWDRLAEHLIKGSTGKEQFVINRTFEAPIERMFEMWTHPKHLAAWVAPKGSEMRFIRSEIKPGGGAFYVMSSGDGTKLYGSTRYLEIKRPDRIVYTQQFCDENEKVARHPMAPTWPETMLTIVTFAEEGPERTRVTITWEPYETKVVAELETFTQAKGGMAQGWTGSLDKLETSLAEASPS